MLSYIEEIITASDKEDPKGKATKSSASPNNLSVVNKDYKKLYQEKVVEFQNISAKTFYATTRAIHDTCTAIVFLKRRVREPDNDDWD